MIFGRRVRPHHRNEASEASDDPRFCLTRVSEEGWMMKLCLPRHRRVVQHDLDSAHA